MTFARPAKTIAKRMLDADTRNSSKLVPPINPTTVFQHYFLRLYFETPSGGKALGKHKFSFERTVHFVEEEPSGLSSNLRAQSALHKKLVLQRPDRHFFPA